MNEYNMILSENIKDCSLDYDELSGSVKNLMTMHTELEQQINSIKTPLHKVYSKVKRMVFGNPKHSVEEVMNMQLMIIRQIRRGLQLQANKTRNKLTNIVNYCENVDSKIEKDLQYRHNEKPILEEIKKSLDEKNKLLLKEDKTKEGYFKKEQEGRKELRDFREKLHNYDLATDSAIDLLQQRKYLLLQEEIIRNTVYTSERLAEKTTRIENQISIIKGIYDSVLKQHKLYVTLYQALVSQKTYITNLDEILLTGQSTMNDIATKSQTLNSFNETLKLEGIVENIEYSSLDRRQEREMVLSDNLST